MKIKGVGNLSKKAIDRISQAYQLWGDNVTMQVRQRYLPRWCEICGVTDPMEIDYENPYVKIEFYLADFRILNSIKKEEGRLKFFELIGPDATQVYLTHKEPNGMMYTDLEHNHVASAVRRACKKATGHKNTN